MFATFAYQSIPTKTYFMTISSVTHDRDTDTWSSSQSQEFIIQQSQLALGSFIEALGFSSKQVLYTNGKVKVDFTAFYAGSDRFYLVDYTVTLGQGLIDLEKANLSKSIEIPFRAEVTRLALLSPYGGNSK